MPKASEAIPSGLASTRLPADGLKVIHHEEHEEGYGNREFIELSNKVMDWQLKFNRFIRFIFQFFVVFVSFVVKIILDSELFGLGDYMKKRCDWVGTDPLYIDYHDKEWGVPVHDDRTIFEFLVLEGAQAGLSWLTVLRKRPHYVKAFNNFDARKIARYNSVKIKQLLANPGIIRNKLKIASAIQNAQVFLEIQKEFGTFDAYIWQFVQGKPIINRWKSIKEIPARTAQSDVMSKDLMKRGFKFVGSTICYAHMQATGMVNDHIIDCFRYSECSTTLDARLLTLSI